MTSSLIAKGLMLGNRKEEDMTRLSRQAECTEEVFA